MEVMDVSRRELVPNETAAYEKVFEDEEGNTIYYNPQWVNRAHFATEILPVSDIERSKYSFFRHCPISIPKHKLLLKELIKLKIWETVVFSKRIIRMQMPPKNLRFISMAKKGFLFFLIHIILDGSLC